MHSAPAEVTPEIEAAPPPVPADDFPESKRPRPRWRWIVIAAAIVAVAAIAVVMARRHSQSSANFALSSSVNADHVLRLKGTTEAVQARAILAPQLEGQQMGSLIILHLAPAGTKVKQGDLLVEFDRQAQMRDYLDKQAEYQKLVDQVAQEQAKENAARAADETELKTAEDALSKAQLEVGKAEIMSRIEAEVNQETLDESKATVEQLRQTFDLKRKAAQAAIKIIEIQRDRMQQTMMHAQANSDLMQIHSPIDGIVVLNSIWKGEGPAEVQEGDQVRPGMPFMSVVNPAAMQVRVLANQQDFPSLRIGEMAKVRLDAYPEMIFPAKVAQLAPIGESSRFSNRLRQFAVVVSIQGSDPKLMPDLSAAVDVDLSGGSTLAESDAMRPSPGGGSR
jgi:HlyD family secretion protein